MVNETGYSKKPKNQGKSTVSPPAAQNNYSGGGKGGKKKVDPMHRKPRKSPSGPGVSVK